MERNLRGGMVGAGAWSEIQLNAWKAVKHADIVALCDWHPDRSAPLAEKFGIANVYTDFETMLANTTLDFVDICTRPYSHASLTRLAADAGIPVLCQKPFCENLSEAKAVTDYCAARSIPIMVNENFRWQAWYRKIKALLDDGAIGTPFVANIHWRLRTTLPTFQHRQPYFKDMPRLAVYELGVHYLDVFRYLFGDPTTVYARLHKISDEIAGEDVQIIIVGYGERAMTGIINHSWASVPIPDQDSVDGLTPLEIAHPFEVDGTGGTLALKADRTLHLTTDDNHQVWTFPLDTRPRARTAAQQHFIDCLMNGQRFETDARDYVNTMALVYAAYQSSGQKRVVRVEELI